MIPQVRSLLDPLDSSPTECDGMTRLCHTVLAQHGIAHTVYFGACRYQTQWIQAHYWIDLAGPLQGWRVDYRLRLWLKGEVEALPHGVFQPEQFPQVQYLGGRVELEPLSDSLFQLLLSDPLAWVLTSPEVAMQKAAALCQGLQAL
jgi:hypothetical protein